MLFQKLQAWQDRTETDDAALADLVGVDRSTIYRGKRAQRELRTETLLAIQRVTGIPPAEWAEFYAQAFAMRATRPAKRQKKSLPEVAA